MPPKAKFSREEIIQTALKMTRESGPEAVTARELGNRLNSSARPVFTVFQNMEEVMIEVMKAAKAVYKEYISEGLKETPAFKGVGRAYVRFAMQEEKLFQLLFMREQKEKRGLDSILTAIDDNYEAILQSVRDGYGLEEQEALRLYQNIWIFTHGIATLCATGVCQFTEEETDERLTEVFTSLLMKVKKEKKG
ncbi:MAG: WHG domain-containing protein [Roseburia sp.]|nr:WHG domain-containing protein [Roseburia sp.]MCM1242317.1 WHG domain-containing protein [Roseburia sp.]